MNKCVPPEKGSIRGPVWTLNEMGPVGLLFSMRSFVFPSGTIIIGYSWLERVQSSLFGLHLPVRNAVSFTWSICSICVLSVVREM